MCTWHERIINVSKVKIHLHYPVLREYSGYLFLCDEQSWNDGDGACMLCHCVELSVTLLRQFMDSSLPPAPRGHLGVLPARPVVCTVTSLISISSLYKHCTKPKDWSKYLKNEVISNMPSGSEMVGFCGSPWLIFWYHLVNSSGERQILP